MDLHKVVASVDLMGRGSLKVNGHDVHGDISGFAISVRSGEVNEVVLYAVPGAVEFEGEAAVTVVNMGLSPEILDQISPGRLLSMAEAGEWGDSTDLMRNALKALKELIPSDD